ncbi:MAG: hypothetical protein HC855_15845 [Rhizobiales bacterium]|nr:hypothetical protein [Hyphomicrobiales bacterium]
MPVQDAAQAGGEGVENSNVHAIKKLFGKSEAQSEAAPPSENTHSVLIRFDYGQEDPEDLYAVEDRLSALVEEAGAGELDGHEIAIDGSHGTIYLYGPNAAVLFATIRPALKSSPCIKKPRIALRYGPPDDESAKEVEVDLDSRCVSLEQPAVIRPPVSCSSNLNLAHS